MDKKISALLIAWINKNIDGTDDPRKHGKALTSDYKGPWRYRVRDYRIIARIEDEEIVIALIDLGTTSLKWTGEPVPYSFFPETLLDSAIITENYHAFTTHHLISTKAYLIL